MILNNIIEYFNIVYFKGILNAMLKKDQGRQEWELGDKLEGIVLI